MYTLFLGYFTLYWNTQCKVWKNNLFAAKLRDLCWINIPAIPEGLLHLWSKAGNYDHLQQLLSWTCLLLDFLLACRILWGICEPGQIFLMTMNPRFLNVYREHLAKASILGCWQRSLKEKKIIEWLHEEWSWKMNKIFLPYIVAICIVKKWSIKLVVHPFLDTKFNS